jgi:hypothetical protein
MHKLARGPKTAEIETVDRRKLCKRASEDSSLPALGSRERRLEG